MIRYVPHTFEKARRYAPQTLKLTSFASRYCAGGGSGNPNRLPARFIVTPGHCPREVYDRSLRRGFGTEQKPKPKSPKRVHSGRASRGQGALAKHEFVTRVRGGCAGGSGCSSSFSAFEAHALPQRSVAQVMYRKKTTKGTLLAEGADEHEDDEDEDGSWCPLVLRSTYRLRRDGGAQFQTPKKVSGSEEPLPVLFMVLAASPRRWFFFSREALQKLREKEGGFEGEEEPRGPPIWDSNASSSSEDRRGGQSQRVKIAAEELSRYEITSDAQFFQVLEAELLGTRLLDAQQISAELFRGDSDRRAQNLMLQAASFLKQNCALGYRLLRSSASAGKNPRHQHYALHLSDETSATNAEERATEINAPEHNSRSASLLLGRCVVPRGPRSHYGRIDIAFDPDSPRDYNSAARPVRRCVPARCPDFVVGLVGAPAAKDPTDEDPPLTLAGFYLFPRAFLEERGYLERTAINVVLPWVRPKHLSAQQKQAAELQYYINLQENKETEGRRRGGGSSTPRSSSSFLMSRKRAAEKAREIIAQHFALRQRD
mmetsp:Transcript_339/g.673  ORF Transcript_339/g.673 Transcript_339/m.673 type:complete len:543 (-) Transcript_339:71-1699(-)